MEAFVLRMQDELIELKQKRKKLNAFLVSDNKISDIEEYLLNEQLNIMVKYIRILELRISLYL